MTIWSSTGQPDLLTSATEQGQEVCGNLDWTFLGAAASHSQFAGVLAGFVLAIMGILLARDGSNTKRALALTLFSAAFFVLAVDSVLFGVIAGERTCMRAHTEGLVASGLLALGAALALAGMAWLFDISIDNTDPARKGLVKMAVLTAYGTQAVGIFLVTVTVHGYQYDLNSAKYWKHGSLPAWTIWAYAIPVLAILAVMIKFRPRNVAAHGHALRFASYYAVAYTLASVVLFGLTMGTKQDLWEPAATTSLTYISAVWTLVLPIIGLLALCLAIPRGSPSSPARPGSPSSSSGSR